MYEKDREFISDRETGTETEKEKEWLRKRRYKRGLITGDITQAVEDYNSLIQ